MFYFQFPILQQTASICGKKKQYSHHSNTVTVLCLPHQIEKNISRQHKPQQHSCAHPSTYHRCSRSCQRQKQNHHIKNLRPVQKQIVFFSTNILKSSGIFQWIKPFRLKPAGTILPDSQHFFTCKRNCTFYTQISDSFPCFLQICFCLCFFSGDPGCKFYIFLFVSSISSNSHHYKMSRWKCFIGTVKICIMIPKHACPDPGQTTYHQKRNQTCSQSAPIPAFHTDCHDQKCKRKDSLCIRILIPTAVKIPVHAA